MTNNRVIEQRLDTITSLQDAIVQAGGRPHPWAELKRMTLAQAVEKFATNGIRFIYIGRRIHYHG